MPSSNEIASGPVGSTSKCCWPFSGVVPPHSAVISMSAPGADIVPPSRITAAAIATARSVRSPHENAGSLRVDENCFRRATCTWSSHSPAAWLPWFCRTRKSSTISCSVPVRKLFSKWHAIRNVSARKLASSACCIPWSQKLKIHPHVHCVVPAGGLSPDHTRCGRSRDDYFLPKEVLREVFRGKFVDALEQAFHNGQLNFQGDLKPKEPRRSPFATFPWVNGELFAETLGFADF